MSYLDVKKIDLQCPQAEHDNIKTQFALSQQWNRTNVTPITSTQNIGASHKTNP